MNNIKFIINLKFINFKIYKFLEKISKMKFLFQIWNKFQNWNYSESRLETQEKSNTMTLIKSRAETRQNWQNCQILTYLSNFDNNCQNVNFDAFKVFQKCPKSAKIP